MPSYQMNFETFLNEVKKFELSKESLFTVKMFEDKEKYRIAKYKVTYELIEDDCDKNMKPIKGWGRE